MERERQPSELKLIVPTYNANAFADEIAAGKMQEFDAPFVPVLVRRAAGVRVVLGTHDFDDQSKPDIQIERRPNGWAIFLHPIGGGDPSGCVYFVDDGRSIVRRESSVGSTPQLVLREWDEPVDEVDTLDEPNAEWLTDDDVLNGFSAEIDRIRDAINDVRDPPARIKLIRIVRRLTAILRAM